MKTLLLTLFTFLTAATLWAQAPQRISYQSVIRDGNNVVVANTTVGVKISLVQGTATGTVVYAETHRKATNANGLLSLEIGEGTVLSGTFAGIDWANGPYLIKTETDPTGGTNYSIPGIAALNSVPYALFSANGTPGPQGERGATGPAGPTGAPGAAGPAGANGTNGIAGVAGPVGPQGPTGLTGATGATGPAGANGTNGIAGVAGPVGPQGPIGLTGPAGANGVGGVTTAGTNITLSGSGTNASPYVVSANISAAAAGSLTGSSLNATVTSSSLTSVGTLANLTVTNPIVGSITGSSGSTTGNAATVTTNANLTGPITSVGNTTAIASQTGTGGTFVMNTSPTLISPALGTPASGVATNLTGLPLGTGVTGTLPVANGGTGATTLAANSVLLGNGASVLQAVAPGTSGNVLTSNGTTWTSATPAAGLPSTGNTAGDMLYWNGTAWVKVAAGSNGQSLTFISGKPVWTGSLPANTVMTTTGKIWMDRNLGATQVALSKTDPLSYGYLYQWGRFTDGHQIRTSATTTTLSNSDTPVDNKFIETQNFPLDWRAPQNSNLWQGVSGVNNPCPAGYRIPTSAEWDAERLTWSTIIGPNNTPVTDPDGAMASPLKLPNGGTRSNATTNIDFAGFVGQYWSSTVPNSNTSNTLLISDFSDSNGLDSNRSARIGQDNRARGSSVRCIKD